MLYIFSVVTGVEGCSTPLASEVAGRVSVVVDKSIHCIIFLSSLIFIVDLHLGIVLFFIDFSGICIFSCSRGHHLRSSLPLWTQPWLVLLFH